MADLSLGILIDIVDEEWMRDTLPDDGTSFCFFFGCFIVVSFEERISPEYVNTCLSLLEF